MRVLLISNGSGEDRIAAQLGRRWREAEPGLILKALALVGSGVFYAQAGIELLAPRFTPPSQGFAYLNPGLLLKDFQAGLGPHLRDSLACLRASRGQFDFVLAVGDIVAVLAARATGLPLAFFGSALSDHYLGEAGRKGRSSWDPLQIHLLKQTQALVFARDALTARNLNRRGLNAHFDGNPMLDCLEPAAEWPLPASSRPVILLLPGSHADASANFALMLRQLAEAWDVPRDFVTICAPQVERARLEACLSDWQGQADGWTYRQARLWLLGNDAFAAGLSRAQAAIGLAGTANEQCVGHGLPVISFASPGQQYSWAFGEAQQRLLGAGLSFLGDPHPLLLAWQLERMQRLPVLYSAAAQQIAAERFGAPGGDQRMIARIRALIPVLGIHHRHD